MTSDVGGRPPHVPTRETRAMVETFSAFGIPQLDIARVIGITAPTLREHYREELDLGLIKANAKVAQNLFTMATKPGREGLDAAKFWLRTRAGWTAAVPTTPEGEPLGKKAQAQLEAGTAHEGTEWGALLRH